MNDPATLTLKDTAKALGIDRSTLRRMIKNNCLPPGLHYFKTQRQYRFSKVSIEKLVGPLS